MKKIVLNQFVSKEVMINRTEIIKIKNSNKCLKEMKKIKSIKAKEKKKKTLNNLNKISKMKNNNKILLQILMMIPINLVL
jgi:hypothetical protein